MGHLKQGVWHNDDVATSNNKGEFDREVSEFRDTISDEHSIYKPSKNRYHLYVSLACPWAHRTLITRKLKSLEDFISVSVVHPDMLEESWTFKNDFDGATGDQINNKDYLYEIYQLHDEKVTTKVTVPVLWDKETKTIVNNESSEIIRVMNSAFDRLTKSELNLYPDELKSEIDEMNEKTYEPINNGVYKAGFAKKQKAYNEAVDKLFATMDSIDTWVSDKSYLVGERLTEADIRLMTTLIRFDHVYHTHFKCNIKKLTDYSHLKRYASDIYKKHDAFSSTTNLDHIKRHYYYSHDFINPYRIIAKGPNKMSSIIN